MNDNSSYSRVHGYSLYNVDLFSAFLLSFFQIFHLLGFLIPPQKDSCINCQPQHDNENNGRDTVDKPWMPVVRFNVD